MKGRTLERRNDTRLSVAATVLAFGAVWGIAESSLGYLLHLASRLTPGLGLAGFVMYPIAFALMFAAYRATGVAIAPIAMSIVAAAIKISSAALPAVPFLFVTNPALAILAEGVVTAGVIAFGSTLRRRIVLASAAAVAWRLLFLFSVMVLPVQKGILMKGTSALLSFVLIEAAVNTVFVALYLIAIDRRHEHTAGTRLVNALSQPAVSGAVLILAVGVEAAFSSL